MELDKEKKDLIEKILHEIAEDIIERFDKKELKNDIGLLSGKAGISLFMFYNSRYFKNDRYERYAQKILEDVFVDINKGSFIPTYCSGIAGVCWTIIHLVEEGFIEKENLEVLVDFDLYLERAMKTYIENNDYDFLHGATGIAFYFTKRAEYNKDVIPHLEFYVDKLCDYAIFDEEKKTAKIISTVLDENEKPKKVYNLSMSHGMSSVIIILCRIAGVSMNYKKNCLEIIEEFSNYIIENKNTIREDKLSLFPSYIEIDGSVVKERSRLAWCYGDIGNGFAFFHTYKLIENEEYKDNCKEIFHSLSRRTDPKDQLINDSGICHGASGINVVCSAMIYVLKLEIQGNLVDHWQEITLDYYINKGSSLEGFSMRTKDGFEYELNVLNGTTGVGLSFLTNLNIDYLNWTDILLIN